MTTISLQIYLNQIDELIDESKLDEAIAHCRHILTFYPRNIAVYKLMGKAHLELRNHDDAIDLFQRVLSADPNDLVAHIALSMIYKERGEAELSLWHVERAFEIQPYNEAIREELRLLYIRFNDEVPQRLPLTAGAVARLYIKGELYQQAVQTLEPVVAEVEDRLDLEVLLAEALWQGRDDQRIDAEKVCLNVLERLPNSVVANSILATIWLRTGRIGESQKYLSRVQDLACLDYKSLDSETPLGRAFLTDGAPDLPQEISLQWLDNMPAPKQVQLSSADWMNEMDIAVAGEEASHETEGEVVEEGESGMHSHDWMMDIEDDSSGDTGDIDAGAVMTDWFSDEAVDAAKAAQPVAEEAEKVPDWLGDLSDESPSEDIDYSFLDSESGLEDSDGTVGTNWFTDEAIEAAGETMVDSDVPDWLAGLEDGDEDSSETAVSTEPTHIEEESIAMENNQDALSEMPDWLATETDELEPLRADEVEDSPDWLGDSLAEELEPIQMNAYEADNWLEDEPDEAGADMMKETETDESEDDFAFLNIPSDDGKGDDDWLSELDSGDAKGEEDLLAFDADDADEDWLTELGSDDGLGDLANGEPSVDLAEPDDDWLNETTMLQATDDESGVAESMTNWLSDLEGDGDTATGSESSDDSVEEALDDDWLNETTILQATGDESGVAESMTNWLSDLDGDEDTTSDPDAADVTGAEDLDDDWLQDTNLLEDVGGLAAVAAAAGAADWLSDDEADEDEELLDSLPLDEEEDLFADVAEETDTAVAAEIEEITENEEEQTAESDWLSHLPEATEQSAVAGDLGSDWLTEDGDDPLFAAVADDELEIPNLDSDLLSLDGDLVETDADEILEETTEEPVVEADDWLSVLTQDDFDTSELEEMTPEIISEYESEVEVEAEEETMGEEDWSSLMYGTDALAGTTLDETDEINELVESDFPTVLSENEIQDSQYDDIPDWLTSDGSLPEDTTEPAEPVHPGDMLDEDDFMPADTSSDWEEEQALDWISDLSESKGGAQAVDDDELSPDLAEFDALVDKSGAGPISTAELLGINDNELPDWMEEENSASETDADAIPESLSSSDEEETDLFDWDEDGAAADLAELLGDEEPEAVASDDALPVDEEETGFTDLFDWDEDGAAADLAELLGDEEPEAVASDDALPVDEEETGFTDLFDWDEDGAAADLAELLGDEETETAVSVDEILDEPEETLTGLLGWTNSREMDESEPTPVEDDIFAQLEDSDESAPAEEEISATDFFNATDLFDEIDLESDEEYEMDSTGLTGLLAGTSLGQSELLDPDDASVRNKTTAEFETDLPDIVPSHETSWLDQLSDVDDGDKDKPQTGDKMSLDWLTQTGDLPVPDDVAEEPLLEIEDEEAAQAEDLSSQEIEESVFDIGEDAQPEDINDAISWLEDLATQQDTPIEELPSIAQNAFEDDMETFSEEDASEEDDLDWLMDTESIAETTPPIIEEEYADEEELVVDAPPEDLDGAMAWLGELTEQQNTDESDAYLEPASDEVEPDEPLPQTDTLSDVQAELDDAMSWLDEISAEPESSLEGSEEDSLDLSLVEETVLDEAELQTLVETEMDEAEEAADPELVEALDWLEQQVLSEGISVVLASENAPIVSDSELDSALDWLEEQMVAQTEATEVTIVFDVADFGEEEIDSSLPDAEMLTGPLDATDVNLFDMPDDPTDAMAWLESMVGSDDDLTIAVDETEADETGIDVFVDDGLETAVSETPASELEAEPDIDLGLDLDEEDPEALFAALLAGDLEIETDLPPIKPSEDAMYVDESLYESSSKPAKVVEEEIVVEEPEVELDLSLDALDLDEEDPEAIFAALLAGDLEIETDLPPIKPSEDAMYVDESLYESSSKPAKVVEEEIVVEEPEAALDLGLDALDVDEEDPEAIFAALLAGDLEIETDLPPIKPSEDAMYVDESLYESSSKPAETVEATPVAEEPEVALDLGLDALDLDEEDPEALFAALLAGDLEIETDLPPIKPSEDAMYVDESLYESSSKPAETIPVAEEPEAALDLGLDALEVDEEDPEALFAALLAGDLEIETDLPPIKPSEDAMYVDESLYQSSSKPAETVEEEPVDEEDPEAIFAALLAGDLEIETDLPPIKPSEDAMYVDESLYESSSKTAEASEELDSLLDVPDDPDEAVAWLEAMAQGDGLLDIETDLPPIKPSEDAVYVDESLYASSSAKDTAVDDSQISEAIPDDPDEAVAWLGKIAEQQAGDLDSPPATDDASTDDDMLPAWMMSSTDELLDDNFDDILDDVTLPEIDENATPAEILDESLGSPLDADVHESLPSWLEVEENAPVGGETGWLRTLPDLDVDSWLAAEEEATVRGFDEPTPLPVTSELSPTPSITSELAIPADEPEEFIFDQVEEDEFLVVEPDSSVSMYSINETELKSAQDALLAEDYDEAALKYHELVSKGGGIMILIAELESVSQKNPEHAEFRRLLGDAYMRNGQLQKALDTYKDALNKL